MNEPNPKWRSIPILRTLAEQWFERRGRADSTEFQRPFSQDWERLLSAAELVSAEDQGEANREARMLAAAGLVQIRLMPHRPNFIQRITLPFESEAAMRTLFPEYDVAPIPPFDWASVVWAQELAFLTSEPSEMPPEDLLKINRFLRAEARNAPVVPIKERSLQLFGDEKRLDGMRNLALFRSGRLTLELLHCEVVGEPFGWRRGPRDTGFLLVVENAATWHSYCRWNASISAFSAVVYGCGNRFFDNIALLADVLKELHTPQRILYFGDLDPQGLWIPAEASLRAQRLGMPRIRPDFWSYQQLLALGAGRESAQETGDTVRQAALEWLEPLGAAAKQLFDNKKRLPQEHIGWEFLQRHSRWEDQGSISITSN